MSDSVEPDPDKGTFDTSDSIDGQTVSGDVSGGVDAYRFSGDIVKFEMRGSATVTIDDGN